MPSTWWPITPAQTVTKVVALTVLVRESARSRQLVDECVVDARWD